MTTDEKCLTCGAITSDAEFKVRDPLEPYYLLISAPLVPGIWVLEHGRTMNNDTGELLRGLELFLVGIAEPDTRCMVSGLNQATRALRRLIVEAQKLQDDDSGPIEVGDGEEMN